MNWVNVLCGAKPVQRNASKSNGSGLKGEAHPQVRARCTFTSVGRVGFSTGVACWWSARLFVYVWIYVWWCVFGFFTNDDLHFMVKQISKFLYASLSLSLDSKLFPMAGHYFQTGRKHSNTYVACELSLFFAGPEDNLWGRTDSDVSQQSNPKCVRSLFVSKTLCAS